MDAVWLVRRRQVANRMRFWTAIVGYDPRDRSISHRLYLLYLFIFFSLWGFAVLALMADFGSVLLLFVEQIPPSQAAILITSGVLLADMLVRSYRATRQSPFVFSEEDAALICQTPVDRRKVAIAWMLGDWFPTLLPYVVLVVVLCFSTIQLYVGQNLQWLYLPLYWLAGFRVASILIPLHLALRVVVYILGGLRLKDDRDTPALRWIPIGLAIIIISLAYFSFTGLRLFLLPLYFTLASGFGLAPWLIGFFAGIIIAVLGLLTLYLASPRLNLSRAAQESVFRLERQQARWLRDSSLDRQLKLRERLGTGHKGSNIPGITGVWSLVWKDLVVSTRSVGFGQIIAWLGVFITGLGMIMAPTWGVRIWAFIFWVVLISRRSTERIRSDLELWQISQQLPFRREMMVIAEVGQPVIVALLLSWLAYVISYGLGFRPSGLIPLILPMIILTIVLTSVLDILRRCRSSELIVGQVADIGAGGIVVILLVAGMPFTLVWWLASRLARDGTQWMIALAGFSLLYGISFVIWKLSASAYKNIK